ncbi:MAG: hypothetical protein HZA91_13000 [Verrucomicrobia bacterium]|nr:hypothetical protein [Verrucomicrobiota bacterium]
MIKCTVCGYDNPLGRVHCLQCGTKIDLSKVVPEGTKVKGKGVVFLGKSGAQRRSPLRTLWKLVDLAIFAALAAAIVLMWQEPPVKELQTGPMQALAAKGKLDAVATAVRLGVPLGRPVEFSEEEINAYLNDPASPHHFAYPPASSGGFSVRIARYQIELSEGEVAVIAVGEIKAGSFTKRLIVRAGGQFAGAAGQRQLNFSTASIGKLPLHALPGGDRLVGFCAGQFFHFDGYDEEWKLIQRAGDVRVTAGKAVVSAGAGGAATAK